MKKHNITSGLGLAVLLPVLCISLLFTSCSKAELSEPVDPVNAQMTDAEKRITDFLDLIGKDNPVKSSLTYDKEEGIWLLESSLTYSLANPSREGSEVLGGTLKLQVPPCSTSISATQLATIYANLYDSLFSVVSRNELQDAYLEFINLDWTAEENSNFITLEYMFGYGGAASYANSPYGPDDWWWYGMGMGRCNGVVCCQGKDATTEIMRKTLLNMAIPFGHAYFTDVEVVIVRNPMDLPQGNPDPNHCYFPLFYSNGSPAYDTSFHSCLSPFEMNYYYGSIQSLMSQNRPYINPLDPSQGLKVPVGILLVPSEYLNSHGYSVLEHILFIFYGISHPSAQWQPHSW